MLQVRTVRRGYHLANQFTDWRLAAGNGIIAGVIRTRHLDYNRLIVLDEHVTATSSR